MAKMRLVINKELCKACEYCIYFCPKKILGLDLKNFNNSSYHPAAQKNLEECTGCGICAVVCPEAAMEILKMEEDIK